jgi:hypothetical protein
MIDTVISLPTVLPAIPRERSARARAAAVSGDDCTVQDRVPELGLG